jgi:TfoX/Sxy family transcriptional regulator of competence genes
MKAPARSPASTSNETMAHLAERIRDILGDDRHVTEKNMFGGLTFLHDGHILVGCKKDGRILLSVGKENYAEALARPGASAMNHNGRQMTGFVWIDADVIEDDDDLRDWVKTAYRWVSQMPAEKPKPARKATAKEAPAKTAAAARKAARAP